MWASMPFTGTIIKKAGESQPPRRKNTKQRHTHISYTYDLISTYIYIIHTKNIAEWTTTSPFTLPPKCVPLREEAFMQFNLYKPNAMTTKNHVPKYDIWITRPYCNNEILLVPSTASSHPSNSDSIIPSARESTDLRKKGPPRPVRRRPLGEFTSKIRTCTWASGSSKLFDMK